MNEQSLDYAAMTAQVIEKVRLWATPIDTPALIEAGVLVKEGAWFRLTGKGALPEHAWVKVSSMATDKRGMKVKFRKASPQLLKLAARYSP